MRRQDRLRLLELVSYLLMGIGVLTVWTILDDLTHAHRIGTSIGELIEGSPLP